MKHIIFGGFDYAVRWEMDQDAIFRGIVYFVDNDPKLIGTTYLGKPIYAPEKLLEEDKNDVLVLIGSIIYHTEIEFQLKDMGFEEDVNYKWGIAFCGDEICPRLWKHIEWKDRLTNETNLINTEKGEGPLSRLKLVSRLIDFTNTETVVDLGAANGRIKQFIPDDIKYIPVDYQKYSDQTVLCDLSKYEFPDLSKYNKDNTTILLIGSIQHIPDWKWILKKITDACNTCIITHNDFARINREYRRTNLTWSNAIFNHEIILAMQENNFELTTAYDYQLRVVIMKFERKKFEKR